MQFPNILGVPLGICQIVLYFMYWKQPSLQEKVVDAIFDSEVGLRLDSTAPNNVEMQTE